MIAGRYSLEREIGRGGMGAVWLGRDEMLGRQVALKQIGLLPGVDGTDLDRAEREARLAARLNHPHVVAVFDLVEDADTGGRWLVMEYVDGSTLTELIKRHGPLSVDDASLVVSQAADALAAAHAAGIVHRDVKPSNILVDRRGRAKLADFGIARIAADPSLTQTGMVTGSPAYLAPEVAAGQRGDEAADVWSLGATLFHALAGRPPYEMGEQVLSGLYKIVNEEPPRLPDAGRLAPLLAATMVKDPAQRWSMERVRDVLNGASPEDPEPATEVLSLAPPPEPEPEPEPDRTPSRWSPALLAGLVALILVAALVLGAVLLTRGNGQSPQASTSTSRTPTHTPSTPTPSSSRSSPSPSPTPSPSAQGMESFIRQYVSAVSTDPASAFRMLTPKFQQHSGGLTTYEKFWNGVGPGQVSDIAAEPSTLIVSYRVKFQNFGTGKRPTVLKLVYHDGHYLIDEERTQS